MASRFTRITVGTTAALLVGGIGAIVSVPAQAASNPGNGFSTLKAPNSVKSGKEFVLKCKTDTDWAGAKAIVREQGVKSHVTRLVANNGSCKMHVVLFDQGPHKLRAYVNAGASGVGNGDELSNWITVNVK